MDKREIKKCVSEILDSLCNRKGFDDWWYNLDDDIEKEIERELKDIIERRLNKDELLQTQIGSRSGVDLSEEDIKLIIETNENPPPPNEKLKEAFKQYKTIIKKWRNQ